MATSRENRERLNAITNESIDALREEKALLREELIIGTEYLSVKQKQYKQEQLLRVERELNKELSDAIKNDTTLTVEESKELTAELDDQKKVLGEINKEQTKWNKSVKTIQGGFKNINQTVKLTWDYLMASDKVIKQTILSLGMSGAKAAEMRTSFELAGRDVAFLGGRLEDIQSIMQGYADETGRARTLSAEMVTNVTKIGRGTGLGVEQATKLSAQFELMGLNANAAMNYAQGVVETAEIMGVNTTKVLKNISENFRRLQKYTFTQGVQGFAQMAMYAEKMHMDMSGALDSADIARSLEGAVDLAAQLQIMGGEFAKTDPFQMLFLARNDPAAFAEKINQMTVGIATFRKNAEGALETFISPADIDRLASVEKSLGLQSGELSTQARRMTEIQRMRQRMFGMGLSKEDQMLIEGMYTFDNKLDRFSVQIGGIAKDVTTLGAKELEMMKAEKSTLEERAKRAQTFDEAWKNTIEALKSILLPMLQGVNVVLEAVRPKIEKWTAGLDRFTKEGVPGLIKFAGIMMGVGALIFKGVIPLVLRLASTTGQLRSMFGAAGSTKSSATTMSSKQRKTMGATSKRTLARGKAGMMGGAGIGAAALGVGAGIGAAAAGISLLADSMSKLDEEKAKILRGIVITLGVITVAGMGVAAIVAGMGAAATAAAPGLYALGTATLMAGAGIGLAAAGIGAAAFGIGLLVDKSKAAGPAMMQVGLGIGAIGAGLALAGTAGWLGLGVLSATLGVIALTANKTTAAAGALTSLVALKGMKEDFNAVSSMVKTISSSNLNQLKLFSSLKDIKDIFSKPLEVSFSNKEVNMVSNITLDIDGYKLIEAIGMDAQLIINEEDSRRGKRAAKTPR